MSEAAEHHRRIVELESNTAVRMALEAAARAVEGLGGNRHYQSAYKAAARAIRALKPD